MDCAYLNFLALPDEVRRHAENALKTYTGSGTLVFDQERFDALGQLREKNEVFSVELDDEENDVYHPITDEGWGELVNQYAAAFSKGYADAQKAASILPKDSEEQLFMVFSGVYVVDTQFEMPTIEIDGRQVITHSAIERLGFRTGRFIAFWDFIFLNPEPFKKLFASKSKDMFTGNSVKFTGTKMQLIELMFAMIANGDLSGTKKEIAEAFSSFFGIELDHIYKYNDDVNKRNSGQETKYLDALKASYLRNLQK